MLQGAKTDLFNKLVPKTYNSVSKSTISFTNQAGESQLKF